MWKNKYGWTEYKSLTKAELFRNDEEQRVKCADYMVSNKSKKKMMTVNKEKADEDFGKRNTE